MKIYTYSLLTFGSGQIRIGRQGENLATRIDVDVTPWKTEYPTGTISLFVVPPVGNGYLAAIEENGNTIRWTIRDTDTAYDGHGKAELILKDASGTVMKSVTAYTICVKSPSSAEPADPPEAIRPWVEQILEAIKSGDVSAEAIAAAVEAYIKEHGVQVEETDPTVPSWAKQPSKPTYTASEVGALPSSYTPPVTSVNGKTGEVALNAQDVGARPDTWTPSASDVGADATGTASGAVAAHNVSGAAHADLRALIEGLTRRLNALADSDDTTLDQLSEIVAYIKSNKSLIDAVTTGKVSVSDIVDNLTTNASGKVLSAAQGVALKAMIDGIVIPTALPNPQPITINGQRYDGSEAVKVTTVEIDDTLTQSGKAADAKAVGDRLNELNQANTTQDELLNQLKSDIIDLTNSVGYTTYSASDNIFDKNDVTVGYTLNLYNGADISSVIERDERFVYNKIISVSPGDVIRYSVSWCTIGLYKDDGKYLSNVSDANYSFVVPAGAKYMRIAHSTANLDTFMMTINKDLPSEYEPYREEETVLHDLSNVPQQIEAIEKMLNISNKRIIIASDLHLHSADMMLTTYGGVTHSDRMQLFVDSINAENRKKRIDAVFINGDLSLGTSRDDCVYFAKHFLPQFDVPCYVFAGDHDVMTNDDWVSIFGRGRQFTVDIGGYSIIGLDGFWDVDPSTSGATPMSVFDEIYATAQIENATSAGLVPIVITHRDLYIWNAPSSFKSGAWNKVKVCFASHTHSTEKVDKIIQTGNFSYPPGSSYDNFGDKGENRWGFRNVEFVGGKIITYMIYPKQTLTIPSINGGLAKTYDYTMDDDNAYGTNYIIS